MIRKAKNVFLSGSTMAAMAAAAIAHGAETQCEWVAGTTSSTTTCGSWSQTDTGLLWDTWERECTTTVTGDAVWCTYIRLKQCTAGGGIGIGVTPQGPGGSINGNFSYTWVPHVIECTQGPGQGSSTYTESKCIGFWESDPVAQDSQTKLRGATRPADESRPAPNADGLHIFNETRYSHERLYNAWTDSDVTWNGEPVAYGEVISLAEVGPGPHVYRVEPSEDLGLDFAAFVFNITVEPSYELIQVDEFRDVVPMSTLRFTNNSPYAIDVDFRPDPELEGLEMEVFNNQQTVDSGESIDLVAEFYSADGYAFIAGARIESPIKVYSFYPDGPALAETLAIVHEPCEGDLNGDGVVDNADLVLALSQFNEADGGSREVIETVLANFNRVCAAVGPSIELRP